MANKKFFIFLLFSLELLLAGSVFAGTITITSESKFSFEGTVPGALVGHFKIKNAGSEAAYNAYPILMFDGSRAVGSLKTLQPNSLTQWDFSSEDWSLPSESTSLLPGIFPLFIEFHYEDQNGHRYSTQRIEVVYHKLDTPELKAIAQSPTVISNLECDSGSDTFDCILRIKTPVIHPQVFGTIFLDRSLTCDPNCDRILIQASPSTSSFRFQIRNSLSSPGSEYPIFAILSWTDRAVAKTLVSSVKIKLSRDANIYSWIAIAVGCLLLPLIPNAIRIALRRKST